MTAKLTIGKVAKRAEMGVETVRFYERRGLISQPDRRPSGYRAYDPAVIDRLRFIRRAKCLGFTLREIKELLELSLDPSSTCADVKQRAQAKITDIESRIASLQRMRRTLIELVKACGGKGTLLECPIIEAMAEGGEES